MASYKDLRTWNADILVVDDEIASLRLLSEILTKEGYQVRPVEKPQVALESALAHPPSLILLDVKMPEMSGFEVCARLKQDERTREVPIIFVSALQELGDRIQGFEVGGVDFISKPIQEPEVLARVETHLQLRNIQLHLEQLVAERTAELTQTNEILQTEITERKRAMEALQESEERFRATFEQAAVGIDHEAPGGRFLRINQKFCDIVGYSREEMLERTFQDITHPDDLDIDLEDAQRMLDGQLESYSIEKRYLRKNGETVWVNITVSLVREDTGDPSYFISVVEDITERKQMEKDIEESEEKFRTLVTNTEEIIYIIAKDGTFLLSEGKGLSKLGLKPGQIVGKSVFELYEDYPDMLDSMRETFNGEPVTTEIKVGDHYFRNWYTPHKNHEGEVIGLLGLSVNITERKRAEEVLKEDLAYHREDLSVLVQRQSLAVKISSFGIWDWDPKENSMTWDNKLFEIYGIEKKIPMPYEDWVHLIHPDDLPTVEANMRTVIETRSEATLNYRIVRPDGELRHISAAGTVVLNDAGEVVKAIGINQDITERKQAQDALQESERLLRTIADNYPAFLSIITKDELDLIIDFTSGKEFNRLNLDPDSFVGKTVDEVFGDHASVVRDYYMQAFMGEDVSFELFINGQDQLYNAFPLIDENGEIDSILVIVENITERKLLAVKLQQEAATAERDRLAQDLHDSVTQGLYSANLIAETLPLIWEEDPDEGQRGLKQLERLTQGALAEMRTLLLELRPKYLADQELPVLLRQLADALMSRTKTVVTTTVVGDCSMPTEVKIALYRIAQEALNNVIKHAQARRATVNLHDDGAQITLRISDDGCGFDLEDKQPHGLGFGIMRDRARGIDTVLRVTSQPDLGTEVLVEWQAAGQQ